MTLQFYKFSSFNRVGGKTHPTVSRRMNMIMDLWAALMTMDEIAKSLAVSSETVKRYVERAKRRGDPRAIRPLAGHVRSGVSMPLDRLFLRASIRRRQIQLLNDAGFTKQEIAKRLDCDVRLVQMRLKEAA